MARWPEVGRPPGRLHAILFRADAGNNRCVAATSGPRGRHAAPVQARGQAGLRKSARNVADRVPRGARQRSIGICALHTGGRPRGGRRRRATARAGAAGAHAATRFYQSRRRTHGDASHPPRHTLRAPRRAAAGRTPLVARRSVPARRRCECQRHRNGRGPRADLLRHADDRRRERARHDVSLRCPQRHARLSAIGARPGVPSARLLHVSFRQRAAR